MGDSSYWTGEPAVRAWERGRVVLYPDPQMSGHRSAVAKLTDSLGEKKAPVQSYSSNPRFFLLRVSQIKSQGVQLQVMDGKQPP